MGWIEQLIRRTKTFKKVTEEYARITESNFKTITEMDRFNDTLQDRIVGLRGELETVRADMAALTKKYANVPDYATHLGVVSECERLKFVNAELEDKVRTLEQKIYEFEQRPSDPPVPHEVTVLEGPFRELLAKKVQQVNKANAALTAKLDAAPRKKTKGLKAVKAAEIKRRTTKAPKFARGTPSRKRS